MELMMVIMIMGIMVGAIVPNFGPFLDRITLKNAANNIATTVRYARSVAIERSSVTKLMFDLDTGDVTFVAEADPINMPGEFVEERLPFPYPKEYREKVSFSQIIKHSLFDTDEQNVLSFQPNGATSDTFIYLMDPDEQVYTVGIIGLTGQVMVWNRAVETFYDE